MNWKINLFKKKKSDENNDFYCKIVKYPITPIDGGTNSVVESQSLITDRSVILKDKNALSEIIQSRKKVIADNIIEKIEPYIEYKIDTHDTCPAVSEGNILVTGKLHIVVPPQL